MIVLDALITGVLIGGSGLAFAIVVRAVLALQGRNREALFPYPDSYDSAVGYEYDWAIQRYVDGRYTFQQMEAELDRAIVGDARPVPRVTGKLQPVVTRKFKPRVTGKLKNWPPIINKSPVFREAYFYAVGVKDWTSRGSEPFDLAVLLGEGENHIEENARLIEMGMRWRWYWRPGMGWQESPSYKEERDA